VAALIDRQIVASVGERIRQRRVELGLTQSQLGDRRYSKGYVSLVECGKLPPSRDALLHFAAQLDRTPTWFLIDPAQCANAARTMLADARHYLRSGNIQRANLVLREAARMVLDIDDERLLAEVHEVAGHIHVVRGEIADALQTYRHAVGLFRACGLVDDLVCCMCSLVNALLAARSLETARLELTSAVELFELQGSRAPAVAGRLKVVAGLVELASGRHAEASATIQAAADILRPADRDGHGAALILLGMLELRQRNWLPGAHHLETAIAILEGSRERALAAAAGHWLVEAWARLRRWDDALRAARQSIQLFASAGDRQHAGCASVRLAEIALAAGAVDAAHDAAEEARTEIAQASSTGDEVDSEAEEDQEWRFRCAARLTYVSAVVTHRRGNPSLAEQQLRVVIQQLRAWPDALLLRIQALHERAICLAELGREDQSRACYAQALLDLEVGWPNHDLGLPTLGAVCCLPSPLWFRP